MKKNKPVADQKKARAHHQKFFILQALIVAALLVIVWAGVGLADNGPESLDLCSDIFDRRTEAIFLSEEIIRHDAEKCGKYMQLYKDGSALITLNEMIGAKNPKTIRLMPLSKN